MDKNVNDVDLEVFLKFQKEICILRQIFDLLQWDQVTNMPSSALRSRFEQFSYIELKIYDLMCSKDFYDSTEKILKKESLKEYHALAIRVKKDIKKYKEIPRKLYEDYINLIPFSLSAWMHAKKTSNFEFFKPYLSKMISLKKEISKFKKIPGHPYNACLDDFDECMSYEKLKHMFDSLKEEIKKISNECKLKDFFLEDKKHKFEEIKENLLKLADDLGIKSELSNISVSPHPFTKRIGKDDLRYTVAIRTNPLHTLRSSLHECGHLTYDNGLPKEWEYTFFGNVCSLSLYESQSLFWEKMIGLKKEFLSNYYPDIKEKFELSQSLEEVYEILNSHRKSILRVHADELNYILHLIIRFEIEADLLSNKISVDELPKIWNKKYEEYFGILPKNDSEGVLSDIHWSVGYIGYFPTYILGSVYATAIYNKIREDIKDIDKMVLNKEYNQIILWLNKNIHSIGRQKNSEEIMSSISLNKDLIKDHISYLKNKFL